MSQGTVTIEQAVSTISGEIYTTMIAEKVAEVAQLRVKVMQLEQVIDNFRSEAEARRAEQQPSESSETSATEDAEPDEG